VERIAYSAAKGGVVTLTKSLALELHRADHRERGRSSLIENRPDPRADAQGPRLSGREVSRTPLGRLGTAEDVAGAVVYFASTEAAL